MNHLGEASVVGGRFRLVEPVGIGDPGGAWRAVDQLGGGAVVVKPLRAYPVDDLAARARFRLAAGTVLGLSGPGIAGVLDFGEAPLPDGFAAPYLVRELASGRTLDQRLADGPLAGRDALRIVAAVAEALAAAHRAGVAHGHVVPANIILGPDQVQVTDFGVSGLHDRRPGVASGVLSAVAPELAGGGSATPAADMYALGVVFVACLAGIASGAGVDGAGVDDADGADDAGVNGGVSASDAPAFEPVPAALASLWAACLRPSPMDRPTAAHAVALSRQLAPGLGREPAAENGPVPEPDPVAPGPAESPGPWWSRSRRGRLIALGGMAAAAAAAVAAVVVLSLMAQPVSPASSATADRTRTEGPALPASRAAGHSPASTGTPAPPSPDATSSVLTATPAVPLSPLAAIKRISQTIGADVATGQLRQDVGVDLNNLIQPVRQRLSAGEPADVAQLAAALRAKLRTRLSEGAVTATAVQVLDGELDALRRSASG